ncbi:lactate dehydrogenase [Rhodococcus sp. 15-649-2-2]|uniref:D-isomer specific 2-hydroxyacid dehydrogenase family protein n=1 Tax=Rhodococcus sp. 15-649-2-2 TaxID=2023140 RepID=UPI000B9AE7C3|nr:lactate dehydrogenase [Rhodococcus sp. 15-649-2-2]
MANTESALPTALHARPQESAVATASGLTVYGCGRDEAALFSEMAQRHGVAPVFTDEPLSEANSRLAEGNRCISIGHKDRVTNPALLALSRSGVEYISTRSIGYNHIDCSYAASVGICVENVAYSPDSVADYTLMLMLMAVRNAKSVICRANTHDFRLSEVWGRELRDLTVGVIGVGRIGRAVIERLWGFGCRILAYDNLPTSAADYVSLDELLGESDIVTLHTPLNADTHHLLNCRRISRMKRGAFVINTGRGSLIDTSSLVDALEDRRLGGAALDVLEGEEGIFYADRRSTPIESAPFLRLHKLPNVVITPHVAYRTDHALNDMVENSILNCLNFERGNGCQ